MRLAEEESEARRLAHEAIEKARTVGFRQENEDFFFIERSFGDFRDLLELHWEEGEQNKSEALARAEVIACILAAGAGCTLDDYRFSSACRLDLLCNPEGGSLYHLQDFPPQIAPDRRSPRLPVVSKPRSESISVEVCTWHARVAE